MHYWVERRHILLKVNIPANVTPEAFPRKLNQDKLTKFFYLFKMCEVLTENYF